jgi:hypothetical protein
VVERVRPNEARFLRLAQQQRGGAKVVLSQGCLGTVLFKIYLHRFAINDVLIRDHITSSILGVQFLLLKYCLVRVFVEASPILIWRLPSILIIRIVGFQIQKGMEDIGLTSLQIIGFSTSIGLGREGFTFVRFFHVFEHFIEDIGQ